MKYKVTFTNDSRIELTVKIDAKDDEDAKWQAWIFLDQEWDLHVYPKTIERVRKSKLK